MSTLVIILTVLVVAIVLGTLIAVIVAVLARSARKNNPPLLAADARFVGFAAGEDGQGAQTIAAFELTTGNRLELEATPAQTPQLHEGDCGKVVFLGTELVDFLKKETGD